MKKAIGILIFGTALAVSPVLAADTPDVLLGGTIVTGASAAPLTDAGGQPVLVKLDNGCNLLAIARMAKARFSVMGFKLTCGDLSTKTQGLLVDSDNIAGVVPNHNGDLVPGTKVRYLRLSMLD